MRAPRLTIVKKGLLLIALPVVSQLVLLAFLFKLQSDAAVAEYWALHTKTVLNTAQQSFGSFVLAHSDVRGAVLTGNPVFEQDAKQLMRQASDQLRTLRALVSDNPPQVVRVDGLIADGESFRAWLDDVNSLVRVGRLNDAVVRVKDLSGKRHLDVFEMSLKDFSAEEQRLDDIRLRHAEQTRSRQRYVMAFATAGTLVLAVLLVVLFSRGISDRIARLASNARRLASREPLPGVMAGEDEITDLDRVLHDAALRLDQAAANEERFRADLEERVRELGRVNEELTQKTAENEMFVYSVSHDLRSPLVNLQGFSKELAHTCQELTDAIADESIPEAKRRQIKPLVEQDLPDSLRFIQSAVTRSANIIDAMLRLSRAGRVDYRPQPVDVGQIVRRVMDSVRVTADERGATLVVADLPTAWGDPTAVEQVLANLIVNALNYVSPARAPRIDVGVMPRADGGALTYYVRDNGLGIPAAYVHKVFGAFQRVHGDAVQGEGIGLTLVRRIVERHGGRVWVESAEGVGSTFFVTLPAGPDDVPNETVSSTV